MTKHNSLLLFCATIAIWFSLGCRGNSSFSEASRVTSPNGVLDAVMILENGPGALGGLAWHAFIVTKGSIIDVHKSHEVFCASILTGEELVWAQPHLLEIRYDRAHVEQFRNLWALDEIQDVGGAGQHDYLVEIRLVPSSHSFSLLTPDGGFKSK